nr:protein SseB [Raoultella sp. NCTC 9187]
MSETKNELETLLEKAAIEPGHRPAFFRTCWSPPSGCPGAAAEGEQVVEESAVDLQHWEKDDGASVIPFFTSLEALQQAVEDEQSFVAMPARTLMAMTLGETLFSTPNCRPEKSSRLTKSSICWVKRAVR